MAALTRDRVFAVAAVAAAWLAVGPNVPWFTLGLIAGIAATFLWLTAEAPR